MKLGYNDASRSQSLRGFLVPSLPEVIFLALISTVLLMVLSHNAIWMAASSDAGVSDQVATAATQPQLLVVSNFLSQEVFAKATVFLLWGCIGAVAYTIVGALLHFAKNVQDEVSASKNVAPKTQHGYWFMQASQYLYLLAILFLLILFFGLFVSSVLPICAEAMSNTILQYKSIINYGAALMAVGITMICLFVLTRLWRATVYSFRVTFNKTL